MQTEVLDALLTLVWCQRRLSMPNEAAEAVGETLAALPDDVLLHMAARRVELDRGRQGDGG